MPTPLLARAAAPRQSSAMRLLLATTLFALACGANEPPEPEPEPEPELEPEPAPRPPLVEAIARPPALEADTLAEARSQLLEAVDLDTIPARDVDAPGPLVQAPPTRPVFDRHDLEDLTLDHELREDGDDPGPLTETLERLFHEEPSVRIAEDGKATLRFSTLRAIPGASVYYGTVVPSDALGLPRHRKATHDLRETRDGEIFRYELDMDLPSLLKAKYDVQGTRTTGRATITWRLEALDAEHGTGRVIDGEVPYRCEPLPCFEVEGATFTQLPGLLLGPFVDQVQPTSAVVSFRSDSPTVGALLYFPEGGEAQTIVGDAAGNQHEFHVDGLTPDTRYRYHPALVDHRGEVHIHRGGTFETPPERLERFELVALSDSRSGHGAADERYGGTNGRVLRGLLLQAMQRDPRLIVFVGDLVDGYTTSETSFRYELRAWQRVVQPIHAHVPIYEVMGNHENLIDLWQHGWAIARTPVGAEAVFAESFVNPEGAPTPREGGPPYAENTYGFDYGNAHFAAVNTNYWYRSHPGQEGHPAGENAGQREGWIDDESLAWLDADLEAARERGQVHLFVFTHEPGFPNGGHTKDAMWWHGEVPEVLAQRQRFFEILGKHRVAAVVNGDEHNYSRTLVDAELVEGIERPVWQLISGGAGAPYYAQETDVPWAGNVRAFDPRQHFVRIEIDGEDAHAAAVSLTGEVMDRFDLTAHE